MSKPIYPCLWYDGNAQEAAEFYLATFGHGHMLYANPMVVNFELMGTRFMGLNGGSMYQVNPAISYHVYCGNEAEAARLYSLLSKGGSVLMELGSYPWSGKYGWVADRYGVNWQLDMNAAPTNQGIVPSLLFANEKMSRVKEALTHYAATFADAEVLLEAPYGPESGLPQGTLLFSQIRLNGTVFNIMSSTMAHDFDFGPGNSFVVECKDQAEIDHYWDTLGRDGRYDMCGWLADRFGISWQIIPDMLGELMSDPNKAPKVATAFLQMQKFDIATLLQAAE